MHYWGVWHGEEPFQAYTEQFPRFMSEYGFQSFPLLPTVESYTDPVISSGVSYWYKVRAVNTGGAESTD